MFTFFEVVNFPDWVFHVVVSVGFFYLIFDVSLPITIVEILPLSNMIRNFPSFPFHYRF